MDGERSEPAYLYDAFISNRHVDRDRKWAEWLIESLERYRVPKSLQDQGLPHEHLKHAARDSPAAGGRPRIRPQLTAPETQ